MRERFCRHCRNWHALDEPWPSGCAFEARPARSELSAPYFVSDSIEVRSMHDGKFYTSKAKLRSEYRAHGVVEIGNEKPAPVEKPKADRKAIRAALKDAYHQHR